MTRRKALFSLNFGTPEVYPNTRVSYAPLNFEFQCAWSSWRDVLEMAGFRLFKRDDQWTVAFWSHLSNEEALLEARRLHRELESEMRQRLDEPEAFEVRDEESEDHEWSEENELRAKSLEVTTVYKDGVTMEVTDAGELTPTFSIDDDQEPE